MMDFSTDGRARRAWRCRRHAAGLWVMLGCGFASTEVAHACASCGCSLSADAAMGYSAMPGWRLSVEYDYIDQDQLRSGTRAVSGVPAGNELEHQTINQYITTGL